MKESAKTAAKQADAAKTVTEQAAEATGASAEAIREFAERSVQQAKESYDRFKIVAEETTGAFEDAYTAAAKGFSEVSLKAIEAAQENANAAYELARNLLNVRSVTEAFDLQAAYARGRFEARVGQAKEFAALVGKVANDSVRPVRESFEKAAGQLKPAI